jgi:hypothetical protein
MLGRTGVGFDCHGSGSARLERGWGETRPRCTLKSADKLTDAPRLGRGDPVQIEPSALEGFPVAAPDDITIRIQATCTLSSSQLLTMTLRNHTPGGVWRLLQYVLHYAP